MKTNKICLMGLNLFLMCQNVIIAFPSLTHALCPFHTVNMTENDRNKCQCQCYEPKLHSDLNAMPTIQDNIFNWGIINFRFISVWTVTNAIRLNQNTFTTEHWRTRRSKMTSYNLLHSSHVGIIIISRFIFWSGLSVSNKELQRKHNGIIHKLLNNCECWQCNTTLLAGLWNNKLV